MTAAEQRDLRRRSYVPATQEKQQAGEASEKHVAQGVGGRLSYGYQGPVDVITAKSKHGLEVKTLLDSKNGKIGMRPDCVRRKRSWARKHASTLHTVVVDDRDCWEAGKHAQYYSGNKMYYKRGVGSFRVNAMYPVRDFAELRKLLRTKTRALPQLAK